VTHTRCAPATAMACGVAIIWSHARQAWRLARLSHCLRLGRWRLWLRRCLRSYRRGATRLRRRSCDLDQEREAKEAQHQNDELLDLAHSTPFSPSVKRGGSARPRNIGSCRLGGRPGGGGDIGAALSPCMLVAGTAVWDLLFQAKLLFVAAMVAGHLRTPEPFGRLKLRSSANCHAWEVNDERQAPDGRRIRSNPPPVPSRPDLGWQPPF
jgi:hypothetical protein